MGNTFTDATTASAPLEGVPSYPEYSALVGSPAIPQASWARYALDASGIVAEITHNRSRGTLEAEDRGLVDLAICRAADVLYKVETSVASEKVGSYQVNYFASALPTREDAYRAARSVLKGTGLTFGGLGPDEGAL